eukprot:3808795-Pyramimonas_sp.AAC.1
MLVIRTGHWQNVIVVTFGALRPELGGSIKREPRLGVNCEEVSCESPFLMGPAFHVGSPSGSSATCNCHHFWGSSGLNLEELSSWSF